MSRADVEREYPMTYERADGAVISPKWVGRDVPVPPRWARDRVDLPRGHEYASLARELIDSFGPGFAETRAPLIEFISAWGRGEVTRYGWQALIAGTGSTGRMRRWTACALVNEIVRLYAGALDISTAWLSPNLARHAADLSTRKEEGYFQLRNRIYGAGLVFIEEPQRVVSRTREAYFISDCYDHRESHGLPIVTLASVTLDTPDAPGWALLKGAHDFRLPEILRDLAVEPGFLAHF